jgi:hypothetical protein
MSKRFPTTGRADKQAVSNAVNSVGSRRRLTSRPWDLFCFLDHFASDSSVQFEMDGEVENLD